MCMVALIQGVQPERAQHKEDVNRPSHLPPNFIPTLPAFMLCQEASGEEGNDSRMLYASLWYQIKTNLCKGYVLTVCHGS